MIINDKLVATIKNKTKVGVVLAMTNFNTLQILLLLVCPIFRNFVLSKLLKIIIIKFETEMILKFILQAHFFFLKRIIFFFENYVVRMEQIATIRF